MRKKYETDLTDEQWTEIATLFVGTRNRKWEKRELVNAVLYLVDNGCKWRALPHDFPPYSTVHSFYRRAKRNSTPSYALIDSQSAKTVYASEQIGYDGGKKQRKKAAYRD